MSPRQSHNSERFLVGEVVTGRPTTGSMRYADEAREIPIEIKDISASGAGFIVHEAPRLRSSVVVTLLDADTVIRITAVVRWTREIRDGVWRIGCEFTGRCDTTLSTLETLDERTGTNVNVMIRRRLRGQECHSGRMVNVSDGGIRLRTAAQYTVGEDLLIECEGNGRRMQFVAKVHWVQDDDDGFVTGCRFAETVDVSRLRQTVVRESPKPCAAESPRQDSRSARVSAPPGIWAACAFVYAWAALNLTGCWPPGM